MRSGQEIQAALGAFVGKWSGFAGFMDLFWAMADTNQRVGDTGPHLP